MAPVATTVLTATIAAVAPTTTSGCSTSRDRSSSMPTEVKKTPLNSTRKGMTSESACWPYSDSEMISPARNAPMASENPAAALASAVPMAKKPTQSVNRSRFRWATTRSSVQRTARRPPTTSATIAPRLSSNCVQNAGSPGPAPAAASRGSSAMIGTMQRS